MKQIIITSLFIFIGTPYMFNDVRLFICRYILPNSSVKRLVRLTITCGITFCTNKLVYDIRTELPRYRVLDIHKVFNFQ